MSKLLQRLDQAAFPAVPATRLATVRVLVGLFIAIYTSARIVHFADYSRMVPERFRPIGIVELASSSPLPNWLTWLLAISLSLSAIAFTLGWHYRITAPLCAALSLWVLTYRSSWGMIFHTENLLVWHAIALSLAPAAEAYSLDAKRTGSAGGVPSRRYGWPLQLMSALTVSTYCLAGITKLRISGTSWVTSDLLREYIAYDALRKIELGSISSPLAEPLLAFPTAFSVFAIFSMALELGAPIALLGGKLARNWVLSALTFHLGVLVVMAILFPYPLSGIAFASFFACERLAPWALTRWQKIFPRSRP